MTYGSSTTVRTISGLDTEVKISNASLEILRDLAEKEVLTEITGLVVNERIVGDVNGTNTKFHTSYSPLADANFDKDITKEDVDVYLWTDRDDESTKTLAVVSAVYPSTGLIVLASPPATTVDKVTADYHHYFDKIPDFNLVDAATNYLTAYLAMVSIKGSVPAKYALGRLRITDELPGRTFHRAYRELITIIRAGLVGKAGRAMFETRVGRLIISDGVPSE